MESTIHGEHVRCGKSEGVIGIMSKRATGKREMMCRRTDETSLTHGILVKWSPCGLLAHRLCKRRRTTGDVKAPLRHGGGIPCDTEHADSTPNDRD